MMIFSDRSASYVTAAEFLIHPAASGPSELVRGAVRMMTPASGVHGIVVANVFTALNAFVHERRLGFCFADNTGFELPGLEDTVRSPDGAFVSRERLPAEGVGPGWIRATPNLVVEVLSPNETVLQLEEKLRDYRAAGTNLMWLIDPATRTMVVRESDGAERQLAESDVLTGDAVLPGFVLSVADLFDGAAK